jgi:hypothetical protein
MVHRTQHNTSPFNDQVKTNTVYIYESIVCLPCQGIVFVLGQETKWEAAPNSDVLASSVQRESEGLRIRTEAEVNKTENIAGMTYDTKIKFSQSYASA